MGRLCVRVVVWMSIACGLGWAQISGSGLPPAVLKAKTVAIVNDTTDKDLVKGAQQALAAWGQFQLTDDTENADITLRFVKEKGHTGTGSSSKDENTGQWNTNYGVTFGSSIHMRIYLREGDAPVYTTKSDDSRVKAGAECVNDFHSAYRRALQQSQPTP